jgi:hypothetical protein
MTAPPLPRQPLLAINDELDEAGWDVEPPPGGGSAARAGVVEAPEGRVTSAGGDEGPPEWHVPTLVPDRPRESSGRLTLPPPMPEEEYVEQMMRQAHPSDRPSTSRATDPGGESLLGLLGEERSREDEERTRREKSDSHRLLWGELRPPDLDDPARESSRRELFGSRPPEDEDPLDRLTRELRSTPPVPLPEGEDTLIEVPRPGLLPAMRNPLDDIDELDDLAVDDVLMAVSQREPSSAPSTPSPTTLDGGFSAVAGISPSEPAEAPFSEPPIELDVPSTPALSFRDTIADPEEAQLASPPPARPPGPLTLRSDPVTQGLRLLAAGDPFSALDILREVLAGDPHQPQAKEGAERCERTLRDLFDTRLADRAQVPRVVMGPEKLRWLSLDHRAGFLLSCLDGQSTIDDVLDVSCMAPFDALRILYELAEQGVIKLETPPPSRGGRRD